MKHWTLIGLIVSACIWTGCGDHLGDGTYSGESLGLVRGAIEIPETTVGLNANDIKNPIVGLAWMSRDNGPKFVEVLPVKAVFPLSFKLNVYLPPAAPALLTVGDAKLAIGMVGLVDDVNNSGNFDNPNFNPNEGPDRVWGMVEKHVLLYAAQPTSVALAAQFGIWLESDIAAGLHLMEVKAESPCQFSGSHTSCPKATLSRVSFETPVTIQLRPESKYLQIPNVF